MNWEKIKIWLRSYWYIPFVLILVLIAAVCTGGFAKDSFAMKLLTNAFDSYNRQIRTLEELQKEQEKKKKELEEKYNLAIKQIEEQYKKDGQELKDEEKKRIEGLLKQYEGDEEGLAREFAKEFGINIKGV